MSGANTKAYTPTQLLNKLQQAIDATIEQLTDKQRVQFGNALKHVQRNHDFFQKRINDPDTEGGLGQMVSIFTTQLDEILAAAQKELVTDFTIQIDSNQLEPRVSAGDKLIMRRGAIAEDGCLVAVDLSSQFEDAEPGNIIRIKLYQPGMNYYAVAVAVMPKRPIQQAELQA